MDLGRRPLQRQEGGVKPPCREILAQKEYSAGLGLRRFSLV